MTGTFGGALEARDIPAGEGFLRAETTGIIGKDENVLVIKSIHVTYTLKCALEHRETAERVHDFHAKFCPVARTIWDCVKVTTELTFEDVGV
ncbi:MAG: hypothetical protein D6737_13140 [Chloroflexi bacterium]|nr:MAG: hypothetical protein D6737_13140 [Chloroflexota bacterium]